MSLSLQKTDYQVDLEQAVEEYSDMVYRIAVTIVGNEEDAKDVFQETFLRLVKNRHKITGEEHLKAWLIRVTTNCAKSTVASTWNKTTQPLTEEQAAGEQEQNELLSEMKKLPPDYSLVLYLYYYEGYSVKEISKMIKKKENSVKTLMSRGRALLKKVLEGGGSHE